MSGGMLMSMGLESEDMKELASALWEILDGYGNDKMHELEGISPYSETIVRGYLSSFKCRPAVFRKATRQP